MKLGTISDIGPSQIIAEKARRVRQGPAFGSKKGKIKKKEDIGVFKHEQSRFAKALRSAGKQQDEIATQADIHPSSISRYKSGVRVPSHDTLAKLVDVLGVQPEDMFPELQV